MTAESLAPNLVGAVVKDPVQDTVALQEYLESVVRTRDGWSDLYSAIREVLWSTMPAQVDDRVRILGIRHHGPGSAALLRKALEVLDPACVLVEGPPEGDELIPYIADPDLKPPVAMLLHASDEAGPASFMPFAEFSPEWQAIHGALKHERLTTAIFPSSSFSAARMFVRIKASR